MLEPRSTFHQWPVFPSFAVQRVVVLPSFPLEDECPDCVLSALALLFNARLVRVYGGKGVAAGTEPPEAMKLMLLV